MLNNREYQDLINEINEDLSTVSGLDESFGKDELDNVLVEKSYHAHLNMENLEDRLSGLLSEVDMANAQDLTVQAQKAAPPGPVGTTPVLGHSKGTRTPGTAAQAQRQAVDPYAQRGKAVKDAKKEHEMQKVKETAQKKDPREKEGVEDLEADFQDEVGGMDETFPTM